MLAGLPSEEALGLTLAVRRHKVLREARILVVDEALDADRRAAFMKAGADDCYAQPLVDAVFAAHVRGLLRRSGWKPLPPSTDIKALGGKLVVDPAARRAAAEGRPVNLSRVQFDLLVLLARSEGHTVSAAALLAAASKQLASLSSGDVEMELEGLRSRLGAPGSALRRDDDGGWTLGPG